MTKHSNKTIDPEVLPAEKSAAPVAPAKGRGRPTNLALITASRPLPERIATIREYHDQAMTCLAQGAFYVLLCGFELLAARAQVPHGQWDQWIAANCPFSTRTAWKYMAAAERKYAKMRALKQVRGFAVGVAPSALDAEQRTMLFEVVKHSTDGETVSQLYFDLGIVKKPSDYRPGGDHGGGAARAEQLRNITPIQLEQFNSNEQWSELCDGFREFSMQRRRFVHIEPAALKAGMDGIKDCLKAISDYLAG